ncbi:DUF1003 domain-containing protein [Lentilactobacillus parabuchneri]|jgi:uncharacterized membrane protein|uniref:DUF1003 domain-containing protein n=2 Tax=Lentilactobacillus parabuchneri TaxID=152331 RepID=A0A1X1FDX9_9LACO|nr:DUF1003 domain-containing protein [Lentilactobacillus parabuchneri]APR07839.1 hypothetical protein FAM21731_01666 [Lentilactobacillus parabuchneri]KRM47081.1 hypothetical protein FC51_GL001515 [Lentilactobacillus parabuchneri DSM 5707 = NBRC 107865]KRN70842.1 hypothetical protein IV42_GL001739 [Lentilactobacillus parabuchneri]MBW0222191.1 DUF1003 domain-containing protein [Lentilactobacillus parabuchneri]MBW0245572.1 DUF1003 domain-containing protein [Lentilactobacillus parabuchneri]
MPELKTAICFIDHREHMQIDGRFLKDLEPATRNLIKGDYPKAKVTDFICDHDLLKYQLMRVDGMVNSDVKQTKKINRRLTKAMQSDDYDIVDVNDNLAKSLTFGQKVSDAVARFGGSWGFIFAFTFVLVSWMCINALHLFGLHFDPYPFILLNLALSCIAAIQAPIIMMSQNRAADRDRMSSENDYHVNQKSEHELRILHAKLDNLTQNQLPHSLEIQKLEIEILGQIRTELDMLQRNQMGNPKNDLNENASQENENESENKTD